MSADFFTIYRGQDWTAEFSPTTTQGATNITGWTLVFSISTQPGRTITVSATCTITDAASGEFSVNLTAAETAALAVGRYYWDVWRTDSGDEDPIANGNLEVISGVRIPS